MKVKAARIICKNINAEIISRDDKIEAIQTILDSQQGDFHITKPELFEVLGYLKKEFDKLEDIGVNDEPTD